MFETNYEDLEWETLQQQLVIEKITPSTNIPRSSAHIVVNRNDSYQIRANLTAIEKRAAIGKRDIDKYSPVEPFTIEGNDQHSSEIILKNCYIIKRSSQECYNENNFKIELEILPEQVIVEKNSDSEVSWLLEWYLNGPHDGSDGIFFPRETVRYQDQGSDNKLRKRSTIDISEEDAIKRFVYNFGQMDRDFAFVDSESIKFIIAKVPSDFGPNWSKNMCIEYRKQFGPIPDFKQREAICEIVSFVLGTQLLNIGFTEYDHAGRIIKSVARSSLGEPYSRFIWNGPYSRFISETKQTSPFNLGIKGYIKNVNILEEILSDLVPKYLILRNKFNLESALQRYWISRNVPVGTNLPVLSGALEIIMKSWFKSNNSKSKALYMPQRKFDELFEEDFKKIENKLDEFIESKIRGLEPEEREFKRKQEDIELKKPIIGALSHSNQMSLTKKYPTFFKEIGLITGNREEEVLKCRHIMAHPEKVSYEELEKMEKCTLAYETLFHRVFLKILGYRGNYVDRASTPRPIIGYPERYIDMPLGGKIY